MIKTPFFIKLEEPLKNSSPNCLWKHNIRIGANVEIGEGTILRANLVICDNVKIGKNSHIGNYTLIRENVVIGDNVSIGAFNAIEPYAKIGDRTRTQGFCMISEYSEIGNDVFLGPHWNNPADNTIGKPEGEYIANPAKIKDRCRIGSKVTITPGNIIEEDCIIGAGSLVTKSTEKNHIYYGSPAKKIKKVNK